MPSDDKNKKEPLKKTPTNRKVKTVQTSLSASSSKKKRIPKKALVEVEDVIKQAFLRFYDTATVKKHKEKDLEHLDSLVSEYLDTFMILGYDPNGEKALIMHARSHHDKDALIEHLRTTLLGFIGSQG